jgi:hypothetical protein
MKQLAAGIVILCFVTGCATPSQRAKTEGVVGGGLIGAGLGAAIGFAVGGPRGAMIGAAIGAGTGSVIGYSYADNVTKRHKELVGRENDLDTRIKFARGVNEDTEKHNRRLEEDLRQSEARIDKLKAKGGNLKKEKQTLTAKVEDANKQLARAEQEMQGLKTWRSQQPQAPKSGELDGEIAKLETTLAKLRTNTNALASMNQRM